MENDNNIIALLFSLGSSHERISGISHLLEHIFINKMRNFHALKYATGLTTEDYIFIIVPKGNYEELFQFIGKIEICERDLEENKRHVMNEIITKQYIPDEILSRNIWRNTQYKNSPLGDLEAVSKISVQDLMELKEKLATLPIYIFENDNGIKIINERNNDLVCLNRNKVAAYFMHEQLYLRKKTYNIFFFNDSIEKLYLLENILILHNPDKIVQLIEKKEMSSLIVEEGSNTPEKKDISLLKEKALIIIDKGINEIKSNFLDRAINELESYYFYNIEWEKRIERLFSISTEEIEFFIRVNNINR